jgi:hypothetical protein
VAAIPGADLLVRAARAMPTTARYDGRTPSDCSGAACCGVTVRRRSHPGSVPRRTAGLARFGRWLIRTEVDQCHKSALTTGRVTAQLARRLAANDDVPRVGRAATPARAFSDAEMRGMRLFSGKNDWRPIESAPFHEDVELFVTDVCGSFYRLRCACRLTSDGWISSETGKPLKVMPVHWKPLRRSEDCAALEVVTSPI